MADNKQIFQHFSQEDKDFIVQMTDLLERVEERYTFELTRFLNPHQMKIVESLANRYGLQSFSSLVLANTEMGRMLLAPEYYQLEKTDFDIALLAIDYPSKFHDLSHGKILGTLLYQLGIERTVFGDILLNQDCAQIFVDAKFAQFFIDNIEKIGKIPVELRQIPLSEKISDEKKVVTKEILVSSMRLDQLISNVWKMSRSNAVNLITKRMVKVNYSLKVRADFPLMLEDLVSVRGFGRFQLKYDDGLSKSGKHKVTVEIITSK
ncbi:hypothetical protein STRDD10_01369 [Streptococcus sp. DD10]|uniref:YlmH family RNA-binding protein n=1 Tax=Streptococcus sp. DD10 TaxID=1777878 RepID=UPI00079562F7|nr:YlmH/Sll1252 family protein [Streptococcus sp. DD10]KXT73746.1 hypothetical protein STRDD10_01369 [Streptococcus sp. DD10]